MVGMAGSHYEFDVLVIGAGGGIGGSFGRDGFCPGGGLPGSPWDF